MLKVSGHSVKKKHTQNLFMTGNSTGFSSSFMHISVLYECVTNSTKTLAASEVFWQWSPMISETQSTERNAQTSRSFGWCIRLMLFELLAVKACLLCASMLTCHNLTFDISWTLDRLPAELQLQPRHWARHATRRTGLTGNQSNWDRQKSLSSLCGSYEDQQNFIKLLVIGFTRRELKMRSECPF